MSFPFVAALDDRAVTLEYASTSNMKIGQLGMTEDGSMFRLCKAGAALTNPLAFKVTYESMQGGFSGTCPEGALTSAIAVGDTYCELTDSTNSRAADYYKDGYVCQPRASGDNIRRIWKSDAEVTATNMYRLHVTAPFTATDAVGNTINVYTNPYKDIRNGDAGPLGTGYDRIVGYVNIDVTSGYFVWCKVRGPHWCHIGNGGWPGAANLDRAVCAYPGGTLKFANDAWSTTSDQYLGFLMHANNYGDAMIMLAIE